MKPNVELHIEELVLRGFAPGDRRRIGAATERELARLFAERETPASWDRNHQAPYVDGGAFEFAPGSTADEIGRQVARTVYGGLEQ